MLLLTVMAVEVTRRNNRLEQIVNNVNGFMSAIKGIAECRDRAFPKMGEPRGIVRVGQYYSNLKKAEMTDDIAQKYGGQPITQKWQNKSNLQEMVIYESTQTYVFT